MRLPINIIIVLFVMFLMVACERGESGLDGLTGPTGKDSDMAAGCDFYIWPGDHDYPAKCGPYPRITTKEFDHNSLCKSPGYIWNFATNKCFAKCGPDEGYNTVTNKCFLLRIDTNP